MRLSLEWLNETVALQGLSPEAIAEALTNAGLEVEDIERTGPAFQGVVVGRTRAVDPHPNADRLRLVTVDIGAQTLQVVCGAPNVAPDQFIAFAPVGATVISKKEGGTFTLEKAKIRGVESCGMICSLEELGLDTRFEKAEDGIWSLGWLVNDTHVGQPLAEVLKLGDDTILHTAPTANRGDHMSVLGVAREVAALFDRDLHLPALDGKAHVPPAPQFTVALREPDVCQYYGGAVLRNVTIGPSPDWLARRLEAAGVRVINNVVDITNYVMLEMGQPLHAFDLDKLGHGGEVGVRRARPGEPLKTLDGVERSLTNDAVLITLNERPVALAGVMGGEDTEVDAHTRHLFLESAFFPSATTRRSAKSVGLRSEASARFERGVDIEACRRALLRAVELLERLAGAQFSGLAESPPRPHRPVEVSLRFNRLERILGVGVDRDEALRILKKLGFLLKPTKEAHAVLVSVPSFRQNDVTREIDLIEEIIRIHGYDRVPYTLPRKTASVAFSPRQELLGQVRTSLNGAGLQEVVTNSLIGETLLEKTGFSLDADRTVAVSNSHSRDHTLMRQSLLPNLLEIAKYNQSQGLEDVWIYETGRTYFKMAAADARNAGVSEKLTVSGLMTGSVWRGDWQLAASGACGFYDAKGVLERLLSVLPMKTRVTFAAETHASWLHPGKSAALLLDGTPLGLLGELHPELQARLKFRHPVFVFELDFEALAAQVQASVTAPTPIRVSLYPAVQRDMAFSLPKNVTHQQVLAVLEGLEEPLVRHIALFDEYTGAQVGEGQRSLAYRVTLQSDEETLTEAVIDTTVNRLREALREALPVQFR